MLQQEHHFRDAEKAGYRGRDFGIEINKAYAMTYSRLYLVEKTLGKSEAAQRYYQLAAEYWPKAKKVTAVGTWRRFKAFSNQTG